MSSGYYHSPELPWAMPEDEERRYRRLLRRSLILFVVFSLVLPFLPVPEIAREEAEQLPPRLAQLLLERQPPAPPAKPPEAAKPEPKLEPKKAEPAKPIPKRVERARARAERTGLLALRDEIADLRNHSVSSRLESAASAPTKTVGTQSVAERSLVTSMASGGSGGINTAKLSRDTGGDGLAARRTTAVASPIGGKAAETPIQRGGAGKASRSLEEVRLVFDRNKGAIYAIYNRALRDDPGLQGKVVLRLTISPSGQVTDCRILSSELRSPELERKLIARVKQFNFGAKNADTMVVTYPIDFLPS